MKHCTLPRSLALLTALVLAGCQHGGPSAPDETVRSRIVLDLGTLQATSAEGTAECASVLESVDLRINGDLVGSQGAALGGQVTFPIEAPIGMTAFGVEVLSNNGSLLYAHTVRQSVEADGFEVRLAPIAQGPVMQVCTNTGQNFFEIANRGRGVLVWQAVLPPGTCGDNMDAPCIFLSPASSGEVSAGNLATVAFDVLDAGTFDVRFTSVVGDVVTRITGQGHAARQDGPTARETHRLADPR